MINAIQFIARYIRLVQRPNALIAVHASISPYTEDAFIFIETKKKFILFKLRGLYVLMESTRNYNVDFRSGNKIVVSEDCTKTYKCKVIYQDVKQFGKADKSKIYEAVGATVVAPSDFQAERHQRPK